jgi:hypothetical protein
MFVAQQWIDGDEQTYIDYSSDCLQDVVTDVSRGLVALVLGEKSGFPSARLIDMGMSMVSVLTGQHNLWGEEKMKSPMKSTDISISFADRIKKVMGQAKGKERRRKRKRKRKRRRKRRKRKRKLAGGGQRR